VPQVHAHDACDGCTHLGCSALALHLALHAGAATRQLYDHLAAIAAAGEQLVPPPPRPFWQFWPPAQPEQQLTYRLLDLTEVRRQYRDALKRGTLYRQHSKAKQQLAAAADAAAARAVEPKKGWFAGGTGAGGSREAAAAGDSGSGSGSGAGGADGGAGPVGARRVRGRTALEEFLLVSEVLKPLGEGPRELLEDGFALVTRTQRCADGVVARMGAAVRVCATVQRQRRWLDA
jgi:hypothetical protein